MAAFVLLTLASVISLGFLRMDNDHWLSPQDPVEKSYQEFQTNFSQNPEVALVIEASDFFSEATLKKIKALREDLKQIAHVHDVVTPLEMVFFEGRRDQLQISSFMALLEKDHWQNPERYRDKIKQLFYGHFFVSQDEKYFLSLISFPLKETQNPSWNKVRRQVFVEIQQAVKKHFPQGHIRMVGEQYMKYQTDLRSMNSLKFSIGAILLFATLVLWLFLKRLLLILVPLCTTVVAVLGFFLLMAIFRQPLTIVSVSLPAMVLVTALCDSIHICLRYVQLRLRAGLLKSLQRTYQEKWLPSFFTAFTTAVGCGSFVSSRIIPLQSYSLIGFVAIILAFFVMLHLSILLIYYFDRFFIVQENREILAPQKIFKNLEKWATKYPKRVLSGHAVVAVLLFGALFFLTTEASFIESFYKTNDPIRQNYVFFDKTFQGSGQYEIILKGSEGTFLNPKQIAEVESIKKELKQIHSFSGSVAYTDWLKSLHGALYPEVSNQSSFPKLPNQVAQELMLYELSNSESAPDVISHYLSYDQGSARIRASFYQQNSKKIEETLTKLNQIVPRNTSLNYEITGSEPRYNVLSNYLLNTQIQSILYSFVVIYLCFLIPFGFRLGFIGMIPNIFPVLFVYGVMAVTRVPVDFATILIEALVLGVAVDDTIHYLFHYQHIKTTHVREKSALTAESVGMGTFMTSLVLLITFVVFSFSDLLILMRFGIFAALGMVAGFWADMVLLPNLLIVFDRRRETTAQKPS